ncbi:MAG TPA: GAF domain-containing protein, partial [Candidatus Limnocylindria bacterium]|nr:GAF domain-containing protein [Candidatus Limnocylindria bacterium]
MTAEALRLLLIDDDGYEAELFRKALDAADPSACAVTWVASVAGARAALAADGIDVIVLAVPKGGGHDLLAAVLGIAGAVPLIALTAPGDERSGEEAVRRGAQDSLVRGAGGAAHIDRCLRYAVERRRLLEALRQSEARRMQAKEAADVLADASRELSGTLSVGAAIDRTVGAVRRLFGVQHALLYRFDDATQALVVVAQSNDVNAPSLVGHTLAPGIGVTGLAMAEGRAVWSADVLADPRITQAPAWRERLAAIGCTAVMGVPLQVKTKVYGALVVMDGRGRLFDEDDARLLSAFADQAALALENARLHEETETRLRQTQTLMMVGRAVTSTLDVTEVMRRVAREAGRALHVDTVGAYLADGGGATLRPVAAYHMPKDHRFEALARTITVGDHAFIQEAFTGQRPASAADAMAAIGVAGVTWGGLPVRSLLFVPMVVKQRPIGGLFLAWWRQAREFVPDDFRLLEGIAGQAAVAADHARLYAETEHRRVVAEALARTGRLLAATLDTSEVAQRTVDSVLGLFGADSSVVRLLQPDGSLRLLAAAGVNADRLAPGHVAPAGEGIVGRAAVEGRSVWAAESLDPERGALSESFRAALERVGHRVVLAVPLRLKDRTIGVLAVAHQQVRAFSEDDVAVLEAFADQVVLALENARLFGET